MSTSFYDQPILNSPYSAPTRHHALDDDGQPLDLPPINGRRCSNLITPVPRPKKRGRKIEQASFVLPDAADRSTAEQEYNPTPIINEIRSHVEAWRALPNPDQWGVTPRHQAAAAALAQPRVQWRAPLLLPGRGRRDLHLAGQGCPRQGSLSQHLVAHHRRQPASEPRPVPHRAQDGHWQRQDHRHGHTDRLADRQRRPPPQQQPVQPRLPDRDTRHHHQGPPARPPDWLVDLTAATEDSFLALCVHLPAEAAEALLEHATTGRLRPSAPEPTAPNPFAHPDALRRFRVVENQAELAQALDQPWDRWIVFLHPAQAGLVACSFAGPARAQGSAGTGKTAVALHRAARHTRDPDARVLLTTFSQPLASALDRRLRALAGAAPGIVPRVAVAPFRAVADELHQLAFGRRAVPASDEQVRDAVTKATEAAGNTGYPLRFLLSEWRHVVDAWGIADENAYARVPRLGHKSRMSAGQRERLWPVFAATRASLARRGLLTWPEICARTAAHYAGRTAKPFTHVVVDKAQDLGVPELRFMAAIATAGPDALFFAGDGGQRIFQQPFSWKELGVAVRGRSSTLTVNYRTSRQIRWAADRLLPAAVQDVDGVADAKRRLLVLGAHAMHFHNFEPL